jgi:hypothetical protein
MMMNYHFLGASCKYKVWWIWKWVWKIYHNYSRRNIKNEGNHRSCSIFCGNGRGYEIRWICLLSYTVSHKFPINSIWSTIIWKRIQIRCINIEEGDPLNVGDDEEENVWRI